MFFVCFFLKNTGGGSATDGCDMFHYAQWDSLNRQSGG